MPHRERGNSAQASIRKKGVGMVVTPLAPGQKKADSGVFWPVFG